MTTDTQPKARAALSAKQWVREWRKTYHDLRWNQGVSEKRALRRATELTEEQHGPCPEDEGPNGFKAAVLRLIGGVVMPEGVKTFVNRWAVLISVLYLGAVAVLGALAKMGSCDFCGTAAGVIGTVFTALGLTADPALAPEITAIVAGGMAVYGGTRKVISVVRKGLAAAR